jgi:hypothetical protein
VGGGQRLANYEAFAAAVGSWADLNMTSWLMRTFACVTGGFVIMAVPNAKRGNIKFKKSDGRDHVGFSA